MFELTSYPVDLTTSYLGLQLKNPPVVGPDPLEDAVPIEQAVVEHGDLRRVAGVPLAIEPDGGLARTGRGLGRRRGSGRGGGHNHFQKRGTLPTQPEVTQDLGEV